MFVFRFGGVGYPVLVPHRVLKELAGLEPRVGVDDEALGQEFIRFRGNVLRELWWLRQRKISTVAGGIGFVSLFIR